MTQHQVFPPPPSLEEAENNPVAMLELREHNSRERLVKVQEANIIREELKLCYRKEGVNHVSKCKDLALEYIKLMQENRAAVTKN
jgi:NADH dehydrogenase (ubiquinone) 1 beta subcomplex subunit 10